MTWFERVQQARADGFVFFDLLTAVDLEADGFEVVLRLWDPVKHNEVLLRERLAREQPQIPTITALFKGAGWHERATAEMFGIAFDGHETERLLLSETFDGTPLRKDFVLAARVAKRWPGAKEPGESDADLAASPGPSRRRLQAPGVPKGWGTQ